MNYEQISYEVLGSVVRICHDRPAKSNARSAQLLSEMDDVERSVLTAKKLGQG